MKVLFSYDTENNIHEVSFMGEETHIFIDETEEIQFSYRGLERTIFQNAVTPKELEDVVQEDTVQRNLLIGPNAEEILEGKVTCVIVRTIPFTEVLRIAKSLKKEEIVSNLQKMKAEAPPHWKGKKND